jgi:hypothetical protein
MTKETALQAFRRVNEEIDEMLHAIAAMRDEASRNFHGPKGQTGRDWGYVGSAANIRETLRSLMPEGYETPKAWK